MKTIAKILSVNRATLRRNLKESGMDPDTKWTNISEESLDTTIAKIKKLNILYVERWLSLVF